MLVLQREEMEEVQIDCRGVLVTLKVLKIRRRGGNHGTRDQVSIGIDAPADVKIVRKELLTPQPEEAP